MPRTRHTRQKKKRGPRNCEALPGGGIMEIGRAVTNSLKGGGKNKLKTDYGQYKFNQPFSRRRKPGAKRSPATQSIIEEKIIRGELDDEIL